MITTYVPEKGQGMSKGGRARRSQKYACAVVYFDWQRRSYWKIMQKGAPKRCMQKSQLIIIKEVPHYISRILIIKSKVHSSIIDCRLVVVFLPQKKDCYVYQELQLPLLVESRKILS